MGFLQTRVYPQGSLDGFTALPLGLPADWGPWVRGGLVAVMTILLASTIWRFVAGWRSGVRMELAGTKGVSRYRTGSRALPIVVLFAVAIGLRLFMSPHAFLHEFYHHTHDFGAFLCGLALQPLHGDVSSALLRVMVAMFGGMEETLFNMHAVMASLTVVAVVFLDYVLFGRWDRALFSGLILAILPHHLRFSASESAIIPAALFATWALAAVVDYSDTGRVESLVATSSATILTAYCRAELIVFIAVPVVFALVVRGRRAAGHVLSPLAILAWGFVAVAVLLRVAHLVLGGGDAVTLGDIATDVPDRLKLVFDPSDPRSAYVLADTVATSPVTWGLILLGSVWAWTRGYRRDIVALVGLTLGYAISISFLFRNYPYIHRTHVFVEPLLAISAGGVWTFVRERSPAASIRGALLVLLVVIAGTVLLTHSEYVTAPTDATAEMEFLAGAIPQLPETAGVLAFTDSHRTEMDVFPVYMLYKLGCKDVRLIDLRACLDGREPWPEPKGDIVYYQGMACFFFNDGTPPAPMHPRCLEVHRRYQLEPVATTDVVAQPSSEMRYSGDGNGPWTIGFYRLRARGGDAESGD